MNEEVTGARQAPDGRAATPPLPAAPGSDPARNEAAPRAAVKDSPEAGATVKAGDAPSDPAPAGRSAPNDGEEERRFRIPEEFDPDPYAERFGEVAEELGLGREAAEKLVSFWNEVAGDLSAAREDAWTEARREWAARTMGDREIGGANLERTIHLASRVVNSFGNEELKEVFRATGLGNHPEVVRFMARVGKAVGEDELHCGAASPGGGQKSAAELIYGRK